MSKIKNFDKGVEKQTSAGPKRVETIIRSPDGKFLATTFALTTVISDIEPLYTTDDRRRLVDQLVIALDRFYVHLNRKKAIYGFDPVRALELLKLQIKILSDAEFHESLVQILARVRDRHIIFRGHAPYGSAAILPFSIETCWVNGAQIYVVSKIDGSTTFDALKVGARISHWNGIPIARYVRLNANLFDGGNEAASLARSLAFLTYRPLRQFGPPLEEWVDIRFSMNGIDANERFNWLGFEVANAPKSSAFGRNLTGFGGDSLLMDLQHARRIQAAPQTFDIALKAGPVPDLGIPTIQGSGGNGVFDYGTIVTTDGSFAYLRFWSFRADDVNDLVDALIPVLGALPQNGLVFDIRGNTGGYIAAGEYLLQLFSAQPIVPARFQFRITEATRAMAEATDEFIRWRPSFVEGFGTGEKFTRGIPIEGNDTEYNKIGRKYVGPVVLVSDALAFSTADIFAAGFIDNELGKVICTDANMAAAGGNNWMPWDIVRLYNPDFRIDENLKKDFSAGKLSEQIVKGFNAAGTSLSESATLLPEQSQYDGKLWIVEDGALSHCVRDLPWMSADLQVYLSRGNSGLAEMPSDITFSVTMRRALRVKANEGRVLEDVGIVPDIHHHMTLRDVMDHNQDLLKRACDELRK